MKYRQTKVYHDGSHYVGIPHTTADRRYRPKAKEEEFDEDGNKIKDPFAGKDWTEITAEELMFFPDGQQENAQPLKVLPMTAFRKRESPKSRFESGRRRGVSSRDCTKKADDEKGREGSFYSRICENISVRTRTRKLCRKEIAGQASRDDSAAD